MNTKTGWADFILPGSRFYVLGKTICMGVWRDKIRRDWRYKFQFDGKMCRGRGFGLKSEAKKAQEDHRALLKKQLEPATVTAFSTVSNLYLDDAKRRFAKKTYKYKVYVYRSFLKYIGHDIPIHSVTSRLIHNYLQTRSSNNNYNVHRKDLSALFMFARNKLKLIVDNPCSDVDPMPHTARVKQIPSEYDVVRILMAAAGENRAFIQVVLYTVARVDEICRLKWEDVNFDRWTVTKWTRKRMGGSYEPEIVAMNKDLYDILWRLWERRKSEVWVFYNSKTGGPYHNRRKMLKTACRKAEVKPEVKFHELRHFAASLLANNPKISKKSIQSLLGHKSIATTDRYLHSIDEAQREAVKTFEGRFKVERCGIEP